MILYLKMFGVSSLVLGCKMTLLKCDNLYNIGTTHDNWQIFFRVVVYELWKHKNNMTFNR